MNTFLEQNLHDIQMSVLRSQSQGGLLPDVVGVGVGAGLQKQVDEVLQAQEGRLVQRRSLQRPRLVHAGVVAQQKRGQVVLVI